MKFKVIKPEYVYLKLIPNNSVRNNETHLLARTIASLYRSMRQSLKIEQEKHLKVFRKDFYLWQRASYSPTGKVAYYIYMEHEKIEFYFIVPTMHYQVLKERIRNVWSSITIEEVDEIPLFSEEATKYQMVYQKEDGLSLRTDRKDNDLLTASLNLVNELQQGDKAGILYNFIPTSQNSFQHTHKSTLEKVNKGLPVDRNKMGAGYLFKKTLSIIDSIIKDLAEVLSGEKKVDQDSLVNAIYERLTGDDKKISQSTFKKARGQILETQILVFSESQVKLRERSYATSLAQSFDVISGDNELKRKKHKGKVDMLATRIEGAEVNKIWDEEGQNFIALPGRDLISAYPFMEHVSTQEMKVPEELRQGVMCIGDVIFQGISQPAYLSTHESLKKLLLLLIGPTRAGKSNLISHLCIDAVENGECVIILDFIKKCELGSDVAACFPDDKKLIIDCSDTNNLQGIGYNEAGTHPDPFEHYLNTKLQASNTLTLVDSINIQNDSGKLTAKMQRYLEAACLIVYVSGGSLNDVFTVLQNHRIRHEFINKIPKEQMKYLDEYVESLQEIDIYEKGETSPSGTKVPSGIIDRLNVLKRNAFVEIMLRQDISKNINLVEEMQKNQAIIIKMPQRAFSTNEERDTIVTYWLTKIWFSLQIRGHLYNEKDLLKVNLIIDEIYQVNHAEQYLTNNLSQIAKFNLKPIISCHYINQLKYMRKELRSANTSYMLIQGCDSDNYRELKSILEPFTEESLLRMKEYHSLNCVKTRDGYGKFITKLPGKVEDRIKLKKKENNLVESPIG